ncbi:Glycosyltransferase, GT2 family [Pseudobutyrivibrio sp. ACV-2]|uniref:glycosyltransferase family 2 protein n=1 Tax=Pseudobutyrivibrio sp. ACV-2 TaxID=1520801 RepID=UPI0008959CCD|nr:glycosyltransferase family 2 protein [Pseudobutyrivibrio sp. ACV-2]SEB00524.1 Glycosyltransferase, GT2 family [Pseudobutyrivibrio sp. ACV-2]
MDLKVSIIIPTYNRKNTIQRAIDSVIKQTYQNFEIIIIDDCSNDGTYEIIESYNDDRIMYLKNDVNLGSATSRNLGMSHAIGDVIAFLDSDNEWNEHYLENRLKYISKGYNFVFGRIEIIEENGNCVVLPIESSSVLNDYEELMKVILEHNVIDTNAVVMTRDCYDKCGGFHDNLRKFDDWDYFMKIIGCNKFKYYFCDDVLINNYRQNDSISYNTSTTWESLLTIFVNHQDLYRKYNILGTMMEKMFSVDYEGMSISDRLDQMDNYILASDLKSLVHYFVKAINCYAKNNHRITDERNLLLAENEKKESFIRELQIDQARKNLLEEENLKKEQYILELQKQVSDLSAELSKYNKKKKLTPLLRMLLK